MTPIVIPVPGQLWNDNDRRYWVRIPVRIKIVDGTHATVGHELDGERLPGTRRIHLSHFATGKLTLAEDVADSRECRCVFSCADDPDTACSLSGTHHVHPGTRTGTFGRCPVHPDAPGDL